MLAHEYERRGGLGRVRLELTDQRDPHVDVAHAAEGSSDGRECSGDVVVAA
jgi:hypothetical protein